MVHRRDERAVPAAASRAIAAAMPGAELALLVGGSHPPYTGDVDAVVETVRAFLGVTGSDDPLSAREREVAELVADGLTNAEIGSRLHISPRTVESRVARNPLLAGMHRQSGAAGPHEHPWFHGCRADARVRSVDRATKGDTMAKYPFTGSYTLDVLRGLAQEGGTARAEAVTALCAGLGGTVGSVHFRVDHDDFVIIADLPDATSAATATTIVRSTGAIDP